MAWKIQPRKTGGVRKPSQFTGFFQNQYCPWPKIVTFLFKNNKDNTFKESTIWWDGSRNKQVEDILGGEVIACQGIQILGGARLLVFEFQLCFTNWLIYLTTLFLFFPSVNYYHSYHIGLLLWWLNKLTLVKEFQQCMVHIKHISVGQYYTYVCTFINTQTKVNGIHQELHTTVL